MPNISQYFQLFRISETLDEESDID